MHNKNFSIGKPNIVACIWDFDKTLSPGYMQEPLFEEYGVDLNKFWREVNSLPEFYAKQGLQVSPDIMSQNHLLTYVKNGIFPGLSNAKLRTIGSKIKFFDGLPSFFQKMKSFVAERYKKYNISLEHYIVSNGIAEIIRGSEISQYVDGIFACEFIEKPIAPGFLDSPYNPEIESKEISQLGAIVDNTHKTRCIFELNKGCNKDFNISLNANVNKVNRRIQMENMIYIADGPSDVPAFAVVRQHGGLGYAVYNPASDTEFAQNDRMQADDRVDAYGPADYTDNSSTVRWLKMQIRHICDKLCKRIDDTMEEAFGKPPVHLHDDNQLAPKD